MKVTQRLWPIVLASILSALLVSCRSAGSAGPATAANSGQDYGAAWSGLSFDAFLEASYHQLLRRDPELVTELGLDAAFGMPGDQLTDISPAYTAETYQLIAAIYQSLQQYERAALSPEQQLSYDIYAWYLDDLLRGQAFEYYRYPITHFITGAQIQLIQFFTDIHPVTNQQQAEDYITRLGQVDEKFEQLIENMRQSEAQGVITPRFILEWSLGDIRAMGNRSARLTVFYTRFADKVAELDLSQADQDDLLARAESEIGVSVIPAFGALADYLEDLLQRAPTADGAWQPWQRAIGHPG